jgi:8-oxo-dGTP pyrophosphatase MutT (NUDIX family)
MSLSASALPAKRVSAILMLYRIRAGAPEFFMQKREKDRKTLPGMFVAFGGGVEAGETIEQALFREIHEELNYTPKQPHYFGSFEDRTNCVHTFYEEVSENFEGTVQVMEGEFGRFLTLDEILYKPNVALLAQITVYQFNQEVLTKG